jgi:hypothetical protein
MPSDGAPRVDLDKEAAVDQGARRALEYCRNFVANEWRIARDLARPPRRAAAQETPDHHSWWFRVSDIGRQTLAYLTRMP